MDSPRTDDTGRAAAGSEYDRHTAALLLSVLGVFCCFTAGFLYTSLGPGSFYVFEGEARFDLVLCGSVGALLLLLAAAVAFWPSLRWPVTRRRRASADENTAS